MAVAPKLNEFTGVRTKTLEARLRKLEPRYEELTKAVADGEELGGGSPMEGLHEEMDALEEELHRREVEIS